MRLGVLKELKPRLVATFSDKAGSHEGHPFLVEAAVSLGGTQVIGRCLLCCSLISCACYIRCDVLCLLVAVLFCDAGCWQE